MSRQQIEALHKLLERSAETKNSKALDTEILLAAKTECKLNAQYKPFLNYLLTPISKAGNVIASAAITALVFFGMASLVSVPEPDVVYADSAYGDFAPRSNTRSTEFAFTKKKVTPVRLIKRPYTIEYSADELLLELNLPSVTELIKSMEFVAEHQRSAATIELISALADINAMIGVGELDEARERYFDLRDRCYVCQLPRTLEALALSNIRDHGSG